MYSLVKISLIINSDSISRRPSFKFCLLNHIRSLDCRQTSLWLLSQEHFPYLQLKAMNKKKLKLNRCEVILKGMRKSSISVFSNFRLPPPNPRWGTWKWGKQLNGKAKKTGKEMINGFSNVNMLLTKRPSHRCTCLNACNLSHECLFSSPWTDHF